MSDYSIANALQLDGLTVFTGVGNVAMLNEGGVVVKKGTGAATQVTLPPRPAAGRFAFIKDGKGDGAANNITIVGAAAATIDGAASLVISANYGKAVLMYNGTEWNVMA